jgi:hypothetical protein
LEDDGLDMQHAWEYENILVEEETPLGRPRCEWKWKIKVDIKEIGYEFVEFIQVAHDRAQG